MLTPEITILETEKLPQGKLKIVQERYIETGVVFISAEFCFNKAELKKNPTLPLFISITDAHLTDVKAAMLKQISKLVSK